MGAFPKKRNKHRETWWNAPCDMMLFLIPIVICTSGPIQNHSPSAAEQKVLFRASKRMPVTFCWRMRTEKRTQYLYTPGPVSQQEDSRPNVSVCRPDVPCQVDCVCGWSCCAEHGLQWFWAQTPVCPLQERVIHGHFRLRRCSGSAKPGCLPLVAIWRRATKRVCHPWGYLRWEFVLYTVPVSRQKGIVTLQLNSQMTLFFHFRNFLVTGYLLWRNMKPELLFSNRFFLYSPSTSNRFFFCISHRRAQHATDALSRRGLKSKQTSLGGGT